MNKYSKYLIKEYQYWSVYVHENQELLGRCYIWCKRENALEFTDATEEEQKELFLILKEIKNALLKAFSPDKFNYAFLGNATYHLHGHIIPRYAREVKFEEIIFVDKHWGHNYRTDHDFITPSGILEQVIKKLKQNLK